MPSRDKDNVIRPTGSNWERPTPARGDEDGNGLGGGDGNVPPMIGERLAALEASVEALRHGHDVLLGVIAIGFGIVITIVVALGTYTLTRIDSLPSDFARTNQMLSQAITAARQPQQIQVVPVPVTQPLAAPTSTKPH